MEIKTVKEMIKCRNYLLKQLKIQQEKYAALGNNPFKNSKEKNEVYERILQLNDALDGIREIMYKGANFKTSEFAKFMTDFLILTKGNFKLTELTIASDYNPDETFFEQLKRKRARKKGIRLPNIKGTKHYFISDPATKEFILENIYDEEDLETFLDMGYTKDLTMFDSYQTYLFNSDFTMKRKFARYPRLKTAIYELIQLKMDNPRLTDEERFQMVLNNTVRRNLKRSNVTYHKKRESTTK